MKILRIIGIALLVLLLAVAVLSLIAPKKMSVERETTINAPPQVVYDHVRSFSSFGKWSPWEELDPNMQKKYEGRDGEVGSTYHWAGNENAGKGVQEIVALQPNEQVDIKLTFTEPFASVANTQFLLSKTPEGNTKTVWSLESEMPIPFNVLGLLMNLSDGVGKDYEKGLAKLKTVCESAAANSTGGKVQEVQMPAKNYMTIRQKIKHQEIAKFFETNFTQMTFYLTKQKIRLSEAPAGLYYEYDETQKTTDLAAALLVPDNTPAGNNMTITKLPAAKYLSIDHYGDYAKLKDAHSMIEQEAKTRNLKLGSPVIESYVSDPTEEKDTTKWLTKVYYPVVE